MLAVPEFGKLGLQLYLRDGEQGIQQYLIYCGQAFQLYLRLIYNVHLYIGLDGRVFSCT